MSQIKSLTEEEIAQALAQGEFPASVTQSVEKVLVVMTQDWCPQWHQLQTYLPQFASQCDIYVLVYNTRPDFEDILDFKEKVLGNREIPYLRLYRQGRLESQSNWLSAGSLQAMLDRRGPFTPRTQKAQ